MNNKIRIMGVLCAAVSSAAFAGISETQTVSASASGLAGNSPFGPSPEGQTYTAELAQFDTALGTLTGVEFAISAGHSGEILFTNNANTGGYVVFYIDYSFEVNGFGGTGGNLLFQDWDTAPTPGSPHGPGAGTFAGHFNTGVVNLTGLGTTATEVFGTQLDFADTYSAGDAEFSQFIGSGTLDFDIQDWATFALGVFGEDMAFELSSFANISVEATYTYTPIPVPGAAGLLAVAGLFAGRRRR